MVDISALSFYQKQNSIFLIHKHKCIIRLVYIQTGGSKV